MYHLDRFNLQRIIPVLQRIYCDVLVAFMLCNLVDCDELSNYSCALKHMAAFASRSPKHQHLGSVNTKDLGTGTIPSNNVPSSGSVRTNLSKKQWRLQTLNGSLLIKFTKGFWQSFEKLSAVAAMALPFSLTTTTGRRGLDWAIHAPCFTKMNSLKSPPRSRHHRGQRKCD